MGQNSILPFDRRQSECLLIICFGNKRSKIELDNRQERFALFKYKVIVFIAQIINWRFIFC